MLVFHEPIKIWLLFLPHLTGVSAPAVETGEVVIYNTIKMAFNWALFCVQKSQFYQSRGGMIVGENIGITRTSYNNSKHYLISGTLENIVLSYS